MHMSPTTSRSHHKSGASAAERAAEAEMLRRLPARLGYADVRELMAALEEVFALNGPAVTASSAVAVKPVAAEADDLAFSIPAPEVTIRAVLNRRMGPVQGFTPEARQREHEEREETVRTLLTLFQSGRQQAGDARVVVREFDVERVLAALRRLALVRRARPQDVAAYCLAEADGDPFANQLDPFQLRHVLTFHDDVPHEELPFLDLCCLRTACEHGDTEAVREWFRDVAARREVLPKGATSYLKRLVLEQWRLHGPVLDVLVEEQMVLDVQMFGAIGWENSRLFYAQLARTSGGARSPFLAYLTSEEIEDAVRAARAVRLDSVASRFSEIGNARASRGLEQLEVRVLELAKSRSAKAAKVIETPTTSSQREQDGSYRGGLLEWRTRTI